MKQRLTFIALMLLANAWPASAQNALPTRPSPLAVASCRYKDTYIKMVYSQPHKRGREIFGKLVPFGQVWRTGANEATEVTLTREVFVQGSLLQPGTYSLFTIPGEEKWTIIFNKDVGLWGAYNYNPAMDVLRFDVMPQPIAPPTVWEPFTIQIEQRNNKAQVHLLWDRTQVTFSLDFIEPKQ